MPPPRLIRPLRPWHPPSISAHARWVSDGRRDHGQDAAPGGGEPDQPAAKADSGAARDSAASQNPGQDTPAAGWWGHIAGRLSTLLSKPPLPASPKPSSSHTEPYTHVSHEYQAPQSIPVERNAASTTCHVCQEAFSTPSALRRHVLNQEALPCWPSAFESREEAMQEHSRKAQFLEIKEEMQVKNWIVGTMKKDGRRACETCQTPLASNKQRTQHFLLNEACWTDKPGRSNLFACYKCLETFTTTTQARHHIQTSPGCLEHMRVRVKQNPGLHKQNQDYHRHAEDAEKRYRQSLYALFHILEDLDALSSPLALLLKNSLTEYLREIYNDARVARNNHITTTFGHSPQFFKQTLQQPEHKAHIGAENANCEPYAKMEPYVGTGGTKRKPEAKNKGQRRDRASVKLATRNALTPNKVNKTSSRPGKVSLKDRTTDAHVDASKDEAPATSKERRPHARIRKVTSTDGPVVRKYFTMEQHLSGRDHSYDHDSASSIASSAGSLDANAAMRNPVDLSTPKIQVSILTGGQHEPAKNKPTISFVESTSDNSDLKLQLQTLIDQTQLLLEKITAKPVPDSNEPRNHSTSIKEARPTVQIPSPSSLQAQGAPVSGTVATPETSATIPVKHVKEVSFSLPSARSSSNTPDSQQTAEKVTFVPTPSDAFSYLRRSEEDNTDGQRLTRQIHTQARSMQSSDQLNMDADMESVRSVTQTPKDPASSGTSPIVQSGETSEQSLMDELFPEASNYTQPYYSKRNPYPKLNPPDSAPLVRRYHPKENPTDREKFTEAFQRHSENITALQLLHCSTELTEADFRCLVPKGQHIESWARDGEFFKVIPGRDPLSLERLPFYYLLFRSPEAALRYQKNAVRLHKLSKLHQPSSALSAIPPPRGLLENGEDIDAATSSYVLYPPGQNIQLNMVMQPYNPALSRLIEEGGYKPIVPNTTPTGKQVHKVLFHIEGYEPSSPYDLFQLFQQDGSKRGLAWPFLHEHQSIHRLRDIIDLKTKFLPISSNNPRAANTAKRKFTELYSHNPDTSFLTDKAENDGEDDEDDGQSAKIINQIIMNRVYNRWIVEFSEEEGARRFARLWNRKVLPKQGSHYHRTWRDVEEERMCNAEYLW